MGGHSSVNPSSNLPGSSWILVMGSLVHFSVQSGALRASRLSSRVHELEVSPELKSCPSCPQLPRPCFFGHATYDPAMARPTLPSVAMTPTLAIAPSQQLLPLFPVWFGPFNFCPGLPVWPIGCRTHVGMGPKPVAHCIRSYLLFCPVDLYQISPGPDCVEGLRAATGG